MPLPLPGGDRPADAACLAVYCLLSAADCAAAYPSVEEMAARLGLRQSKVWAALERLYEEGCINDHDWRALQGRASPGGPGDDGRPPAG